MRWIKSCSLPQSFVVSTVGVTGISFSKIACEWFVRLKAKDITDAECDQHSDWIEKSPDHQQAYLDLNQQWEEMDELIPWARDEVKRLESRFEKGAEQGKPRAQYWCWRQSRNSLFVWVSIFAVVATSLLSAVFITTP